MTQSAMPSPGCSTTVFSLPSTIDTTVATTAGGTTSILRPVSTLLDQQAYPLTNSPRCITSAGNRDRLLQTESDTTGPQRVLRAATAADVYQEIYALLIVYQAARHLGRHATGHAGTDPTGSR